MNKMHSFTVIACSPRGLQKVETSYLMPTFTSSKESPPNMVTCKSPVRQLESCLSNRIFLSTRMTRRAAPMSRFGFSMAKENDRSSRFSCYTSVILRKHAQRVNLLLISLISSCAQKMVQEHFQHSFSSNSTSFW